MSKPLPPRYQKFVNNMVHGMTISKAAEEAGYSAKTAHSQGSRLLKKAEIQAAIKIRMERAEEKAEISAAYVLNGLKEVADRCLQKAPVMVRDGRDMVQAKDEEGRDVWQFDSLGANKAFELLGKHKKLFTDRIEHGLTDELAADLKAARERLNGFDG
jgi:phage terminase small subunit